MPTHPQPFPVYYGGFDPGSGRAGLFLIPTDDVELKQETITIESLIATEHATMLLQRGDLHATLADVLREDECLIQWNQSDYFLADLVKEGKHATAELGHPGRYWGDHARVLLLALASMLIPERAFQLRLVTALPVTLYTREHRKRMQEALTNTYCYYYNGHQREASIVVGYVAMEGQGILIHAGASDGEQALLDIGERTIDAVTANGQMLLTRLCQGNEELGIERITSAVQALAKQYGRVLSASKAHELMWAWAHKNPLPSVRTQQGNIPEQELVATIEQARRKLAREITSFASSLWNVEGEAVGERFEQIFLGGGGAYYVGDLLAQALPRVTIPPDPEQANMRGYADLALTLEDKVPTVWEVD